MLFEADKCGKLFENVCLLLHGRKKRSAVMTPDYVDAQVCKVCENTVNGHPVKRRNVLKYCAGTFKNYQHLKLDRDTDTEVWGRFSSISGGDIQETGGAIRKIS